MRAFIKHIGILLVLFIGLSTLISAGSLWALRQSDFYKPSFLVNEVKQDAFDYIILGASTGLTTLNTQVIDSINQTRGLNLAMDDTSLPTQYVMLQHFLAEGNTADYCILAPNNTNFDTQHNGLSDNDYRFLPYVNRPYVHDYFSQFSGTNARVLSGSKWLPVLGVSYYNTEIFYPSLLSLVNPNRRNRFDARGNYAYPFIKFEDAILTDFEDVSVTFKNEYLKKIKDLCETNGIQLICYFTPMMDKRMIVKDANYKTINHSDLLKNARYFNDVIHVNYIGNRLASHQFATDFKWYLNSNEVIDER